MFLDRVEKIVDKLARRKGQWQLPFNRACISLDKSAMRALSIRQRYAELILRGDQADRVPPSPHADQHQYSPQ
jgi:hypothetical protein